MGYGKRVYSFLLIILIICLGGCSGKLFVPFATWVQIDISSDETINPDESGRASPVVLRIYELKDTASFQSKDFFQIYDNDSEALGDSLLKKEEINLRPNENAFIERKFGEDAAYIGVFAAFRNVDDAQWRTFLKLRQNRTNAIKINLRDIKVSVSQHN